MGAQVSRRVRDAVHARLSHAWESAIRGAAAAYDIPAADADAIARIDWTGRARRQVFLSQMDFATLAAPAALVYPAVTLYTDQVIHTGETKWQTFSGTVTALLSFAYSWRKSSAVPNFDEFLDLIEDGVLLCLHDQRWAESAGSDVTYQGVMDAARSPVQIGGDNWLQVAIYRLTFGVDV